GPPPGQDGPWTAEGPPATPPPLRNRPGPVFSKNQKTLLLVLSVAAAALVISSLYLSLGSGPGQEAAPAPRAPAAPQGQETAGEDLAAAQDDGASRILLSFLPNSTHHYLENREAGRLLVITGQIQNDDDRPISFIRVKAKLVDGQDKILAERQVFAGNLLNEEELTALPMKDILSRLSLRGGQNGLNTNLAPSKSIPYMLVFDRLPAEAASYSVEPVSYSEASAANPG
ncbi:MAG: DUF3426 domain-containing protein, partial [Deltaproteobacteria bacterium]|nr:DUF3426 domain-containing protein [Deltaproteobacteria bacterium]